MKKGSFLIISILVVIITSAIAAWIGLRQPAGNRFQADIVGSLSSETSNTNFTKATGVKPFIFPDDFGPHPQYQTEWWYYTGNLVSIEGRRFGYQFTIFRRAIADQPVKSESNWRSNQIYFAHFAVTDIKNEKFYSFERFSRGAAGLAGAKANPYRVWIEDWQVQQEDEKVRMQVKEKGIAIDLLLHSIKPMVFHGNRGYSRKGKEKGNASYYFSQTRISTSGTISVDESKTQVEGFSWLDKEWSTSGLEADDTGWDWFSIQLNDNRELMLFQIRTKTGGINPYSSGSYIDASGEKTHLTKDQFSIIVEDTWTSKKTKASYPSSWKIEIPSLNLILKATPFINDQEHRHSFSYWEGAISVESEQVSGHGYVELTGY